MMSDWERLLAALKAGAVEKEDPGARREAFAHLAQYHGLVARINAESLRAARQRNRLFALRNLSHLRMVAESFDKEGVPYLCFKGLPLALRLFGDVGHRHAGDVDLWVSEQDIDRIDRLLLRAGHRHKTGYATLSPHFQEKYRKLKFHIGYTHEGSGVSLEIHWRLGTARELFPYSFEEVYTRRRVQDAGSFQIPALGDADHLLFLYIHAARHLWERLFWLVDIVEYHQRDGVPSPREILELATRLGTERAVFATWKLAAEFLNFDPETSIPQEAVVERLAAWGRRHLVRSRHGMNSAEALLSGMALHRSFSHKMQILAEYVTAADDWHQVKVPAGFGWLYVMLRPWFWARRRFAPSS